MRTGRWSRSSGTTLRLSFFDTRRHLSSICAPPPSSSVTATTHGLHRHPRARSYRSYALPPHWTMANNSAAAVIQCENCTAANHESEHRRRTRDCIDRAYDFTFYDQPGTLLKLTLMQTFLGLIIVGLGSGCSVHGVVNARDDGVINCIDCKCIFKIYCFLMILQLRLKILSIRVLSTLLYISRTKVHDNIFRNVTQFLTATQRASLDMIV